MRFVTLALLVALAACTTTPPRVEKTAAFRCVVIGCQGGLYEDALSCTLVAPATTSTFVALDAGTLLSGIRRARERGTIAFEGDDVAFLRERVGAYLISHAHLDHTAGLVIASPDDGPKPILGLDPTLDAIRDGLFNGQVWPNLAN